jgi:hypothetical protein
MITSRRRWVDHVPRAVGKIQTKFRALNLEEEDSFTRPKLEGNNKTHLNEKRVYWILLA